MGALILKAITPLCEHNSDIIDNIFSEYTTTVQITVECHHAKVKQWFWKYFLILETNSRTEDHYTKVAAENLLAT